MRTKAWIWCACLAALVLIPAGCGGAAGAVYWERLPAPLDREEVHGLEYAAGEGALYAATNSRGIWRCGGASSELLSGPLDSVLVFSLAVAGDGSVLYAAAGDKGVWRFAGGVWSDAGLPGAAYVLQLDEDAGVLYAGTNHAVWRYGGGEWEPLEGLPDAKVFSFTRGSGDTLYAGTESGVWEFSGGEWRAVGRGLEELDVLSLACDRTEGRLYAGTRNEGVWALEDGYWKRFEKGPLENSAWSMEYSNELRLLLVGTSYGVWSYDGSLWIWTEGEVKEYSILAIAVDAASLSAYVGTFEDVGVWKGDLDGILDSR